MNKKLKRMAVVGATVLMTASSVGFSNAMQVKKSCDLNLTGKMYVCINGKRFKLDLSCASIFDTLKWFNKNNCPNKFPSIDNNKDDNDIEVYMNVSKSFVKIYIKDYGIGIEAHELENIFEEFIKLDDGLTRPCEGSGIGLSIVNEFTRIHKGEVRVFSELGRGTTFEVILPNKINNTANRNIKNNKYIQNKMERCNIEFSDIYN